MVKAHNKSRSELSAMKVAELKTLIRKHNLDNAIRGYSAMKKADLVDALVKHSGGEKAAAKPAAKKRKLEIVEEKKKPAPKPVDDDLEDDFFANIGKGKGAIKKTTVSASYLASKKALRELRLKDPAAYEAKIKAINAAQKAAGPSHSELFDMKKKAAREAAAKKATKKPAAKKAAKKPAAK